MLSHAYTVNSASIPTSLSWVASAGISNFYTNGFGAPPSGAQTPLQNAYGEGTGINWSISGRHKFKRDSLGVAFSGSRQWYSGGEQYTGITTRLGVNYMHVVSRRISLQLTGSGNFLPPSSALVNQAPGPETPAADINTAITPGPEIFNTGIKQFTTGMNATWQKSTRLSFSGGASYFVTMYDAPGFIGMNGEQVQGNMNYRLTSKTTAGLFYSYSVYTYQHGQGTNNSDSMGALYSHDFNRTLRLQLRAGAGTNHLVAYQVVPLSPVAAELYGISSEIVEGNQKSMTQDISAQLMKDFGTRGTVALSYSKGIMPGNGLFLASEQETFAVNASLRLFHRYLTSISAGRQSFSSAFTSVPGAAGSYVTDYVHIASSKPLTHSMSLSYGLDYRYFQVTEFPGLRSLITLNCSFTWNHSEDRLWPLHW